MSPEGGARAWSPRLSAVVAKTDRDSGLTLGLPAHLSDAMAVAELLWEGFLPTSVRGLLAVEAGSPAAAVALARFLAGTHDVGKASDAFQRSLPPDATSGLRQHGITLGNSRQQEPHGTLGQIALEEWLSRHHGRGPGARQLPEVIGGHHGLNPTTGDTDRARTVYFPLERSVWRELRDELIEEMAERSGAVPYLADWVARGLSLPARVLLQGIVILADWIASNTDYFPFLDARSPHERAADAVSALALGAPWSPPPPVPTPALFAERFPALSVPNPLQLATADVARTAAAPCLLVIEARPGLGKTEAGLLAAEILAERFGAGGLFVGLPTMATANPMFLRVVAWLQTMGEQVNSLNLAHGKAALNRDYAALLPNPRVSAVYGDGDRVRVVSWLRGRKRNLLANSVVGTIDQFLMGGLKAKHLALRHLALAGKVVLIDEVHAADDFMREYALVMLEWLGRYRAPVILMSATLPPEQRHQYLAAYARGRGEVVDTTTLPTGYPLLTRYDGQLASVMVHEATAGQQVRLERVADDDLALADRLARELAQGGCAAVIRNTVRRAQLTFETLKQRFGDEVVLLHSRFISPHRIERERRLVAALGRGGDRPLRLIVVGTQVLEQSLDVDFDLMVSDLAPIDLLLQRAGRLHRHERRQRPAAVAEPVLLLAGADWETTPPTPDPGSARIYGTARLLRAVAVLQRECPDDALAVPAALPRLVAAGYDPELAPPEGWEADWAEAEEQQRARTDRARRRARDFAIAAPRDTDPMGTWLLAHADDPESPDRMGRAQVRDSGDSIEVIVLQRDGDGVLRLPAGPGPRAGQAIPEGLTPLEDGGLARAMAETTISLPLALCASPSQVDRTIAGLERSLAYDTWQSSPWLAGQLALVLDAAGRARLAGFDITYSDELGLTATRAEGNT